jgi:hypothetical protein
MKQISNKEYEKYQQYLTDQLHGRTLTPDGLRIICASFDYHSPFLFATLFATLFGAVCSK